MNYGTWIMTELYGKRISHTALKNLMRHNAAIRDERFSSKAFAGALDDLLYTGKIVLERSGNREYYRRG